MSKWSESAELLQKIMTAKEVVPLQGDLINLQQTMFNLQADQMKLVDENSKLKDQLHQLLEKKEYKYQDGRTWLFHPDRPDIALCPACFNRDGFENPMVNSGSERYCSTCKNVYR